MSVQNFNSAGNYVFLWFIRKDDVYNLSVFQNNDSMRKSRRKSQFLNGIYLNGGYKQMNFTALYPSNYVKHI